VWTDVVVAAMDGERRGWPVRSLLSLSFRSICFSLLLAALLALLLNSPVLAITFQRTIGTSNGQEYATSIEQTPDGGYIVVGGRDNNNVYLVKLDAGGLLQWDRLITFPLTTLGSCVHHTSDGGYIVAGETFSGVSGQADLVFKTDATGSMVQWSYQSPGDFTGIEHGCVVRELSSGGYILIGCGTSTGQAGGVLTKLNANGTIVWSELIVGNGSNLTTFCDVREVAGGNLVVVGANRSASDVNTVQTLLLETNSAGVVQWAKTYGAVNDKTDHQGLELASDGGLIVHGDFLGGATSGSYVFKTNAAGTLVLWQHQFADAETTAPSVRTDAAGNVILDSGTLDGHAALLRLTSAGAFIGGTKYTPSGISQAFEAVPTADGGYAIAGRLTSPADLYIVKTEAAGLSGCDESSFTPTQSTPTLTLQTLTVTTNVSSPQTPLSPTKAAAGSQQNAICTFGGAWTTLASNVICRYDLPGAAVGTDNTGTKLIYVIGDESTNAVEAYNPGTNSWSPKTSMPGSPIRYGFGTVAGGDGRIYTMGGLQAIANGATLKTVQAYDPATDSWVNVASMVVARFRPAAAAGPDGRIYVFGGQGSGGATLSSAEVYDPLYDTWTSIAPMPQGSSLPACAALVRCANAIYVVGPTDNVQAYSTRSGAWFTRGQPSGLPTDFAMVAGRDGHLYVVGGNRDPVGPTNTMEVYDPLTDTWTPGPPMVNARASLAAVSLGPDIYAIDGGGACQALESYGPLAASVCPCLTPPTGMVAWWPLDEVYGTGTDEVIGGASSSLVGGASHVPGIVAGAVHLAGAGQYVSVSSVSALNFGTSSFSLDAWVRTLDGTTDVRTIIDKRSGPTSTPTGYSLAISYGRVVLQLADGTGFTNFSQSAPGALTDRAWHLVAATVDRTANVGKLYDNGAVVYTFTPSTQPGSVTNSGGLRLGQAYDNSSINFDGDIDEVEEFNRALTGAEVAAIWQAGGSGKCKPTGGILVDPDPIPIEKKPPTGEVGGRILGAHPAVTSTGTELRLSRALDAPGRFTIYDIAGRAVRTLELSIGATRVSWDGHDARGGRVSAGIYLVQVTAGGISSQTRVVVLP